MTDLKVGTVDIGPENTTLGRWINGKLRETTTCPTPYTTIRLITDFVSHHNIARLAIGVTGVEGKAAQGGQLYPLSSDGSGVSFKSSLNTALQPYDVHPVEIVNRAHALALGEADRRTPKGELLEKRLVYIGIGTDIIVAMPSGTVVNCHLDVEHARRRTCQDCRRNCTKLRLGEGALERTFGDNFGDMTDERWRKVLKYLRRLIVKLAPAETQYVIIDGWLEKALTDSWLTWLGDEVGHKSPLRLRVERVHEGSLHRGLHYLTLKS